jgi:hypothetical protein
MPSTWCKMKNQITIVYNSSKEMLSKKPYFLSFLLLILLMFALYVIIPVFSIPGNTILFQLSIWEFKDYAVIIPLSFLVALMITMQVYVFKQKKKNTMRETGKSVVGGYSGIVAGVFGTASCSSCVAAIFGFLGTGGVLFLVRYQGYVVAISLILVLLSLYLSSISLQKECKIC